LETNIAGAVVKNMEFGLGLGATSTDGVMGVGFDTNEAILQIPGAQPYPNLVDTMVAEKFIQSRTYSLYLDDQDASTGVILFGGVDTDKFSGALATFPINVDVTGTASAFVISLTGLSLSPPGGETIGIGASSLFPMSVLLDSGSSYMSLPSGVAQGLADAMGASYSRELSGYLLPNCKSEFAEGSLNFFFSGVGIAIPYHELIVNPTDSNGEPILYNDGTPVCMLGVISQSSSDLTVLGDTFLRSAYVVFDLVPSPFSCF
jgi:Eukaryotic aspartyl protease